MRPTFRKPEHLCSRSAIEQLFSGGNATTSAFPLRAVYRPRPHAGSGPRVRVLLSVSKRRLHHAVDRNRAKRQLREAYRLQKPDFLAALPATTGLDLAFIWLSDTPLDTALVQKRMKKLLAGISGRMA